MEEDQSSADARAGRPVATRTATKAAARTGRKLLIAVGVKGGCWIGPVVLLLWVIAAATGASRRPGRVRVGGRGCARSW